MVWDNSATATVVGLCSFNTERSRVFVTPSLYTTDQGASRYHRSGYLSGGHNFEKASSLQDITSM